MTAWAKTQSYAAEEVTLGARAPALEGVGRGTLAFYVRSGRVHAHLGGAAAIAVEQGNALNIPAGTAYALVPAGPALVDRFSAPAGVALREGVAASQRLVTGLEGARIEKPLWGHEEIVVNNAQLTGKLLYVEPSKRLSVQHHAFKDETLRYLTDGLLYVVPSDGPLRGVPLLLRMKPGDTYRVTPGTIHQIRSTDRQVVVQEVETSHLNDTIRHQS